MFTGIVEALGTVRRLRRTRGADLLEIEMPRAFRNLKKGGSLAVNGVCLTLAGKTAGRGRFHLADETKKKTTLADLKAGQRVHLERPLPAKGRVEGHFVLGHADGVGQVQKIVRTRGGKSFRIAFPSRLRPYLVEKGSIAVDGVSLTLGKISRRFFWVHGIPHTLKTTNFGRLTVKSRVNLEADVLAKWAVMSYNFKNYFKRQS